MNIEKLREINNKLLGSDIKYQKIALLLEYDDCFFKISIETAYQILSDLGFKNEEIKDIYSQLISEDEYKKNYQKYKIKKENTMEG